MGRMINPRRLRDCYASTLPPTRPQFDRYLQDLSDWIQYLRHTQAAVFPDHGDHHHHRYDQHLSRYPHPPSPV